MIGDVSLGGGERGAGKDLLSSPLSTPLNPWMCMVLSPATSIDGCSGSRSDEVASGACAVVYIDRPADETQKVRLDG